MFDPFLKFYPKDLREKSLPNLSGQERVKEVKIKGKKKTLKTKYFAFVTKAVTLKFTFSLHIKTNKDSV